MGAFDTFLNYARKIFVHVYELVHGYSIRCNSWLRRIYVIGRNEKISDGIRKAKRVMLLRSELSNLFSF